jgi:hypothetical protein
MVLQRAVILTACAPGQQSFAAPPNKQYDEFLFQLSGALGGSYPDGSALREPVPPAPSVTLAQAFAYARKHDRWSNPDGLRVELPSLADPAGLAPTLNL